MSVQITGKLCSQLTLFPAVSNRGMYQYIELSIKIPEMLKACGYDSVMCVPENDLRKDLGNMRGTAMSWPPHAKKWIRALKLTGCFIHPSWMAKLKDMATKMIPLLLIFFTEHR